MNKILLISLVIIATAFACTTVNQSTPIPSSQNAISDGGFLTKHPCGPPCFYGIVPGKTTISEARQIMENSGSIFSNCEPFDFSSTGGKRGTNCDNVNLGYQDNMVSMLSFTPSEAISMQMVLDLYGPPNLISVGIISLPDYPDKTRMMLFLDPLHSMLQLSDQDGNEYIVGAGTKITSVIYLSGDRYKSILDQGKNLPWQGFTSYIGTR